MGGLVEIRWPRGLHGRLLTLALMQHNRLRSCETCTPADIQSDLAEAAVASRNDQEVVARSTDRYRQFINDPGTGLWDCGIVGTGLWAGLWGRDFAKRRRRSDPCIPSHGPGSGRVAAGIWCRKLRIWSALSHCAQTVLTVIDLGPNTESARRSALSKWPILGYKSTLRAYRPAICCARDSRLLPPQNRLASHFMVYESG